MRNKLGGLLAAVLVTWGAGAYAAPGAATLLTPANGGATTARRPTLTWSAVSGAEWCHLWIQRDGSYYFDWWVQGATSWTPWWDFPVGGYQFWVQTWGGGSYGPWSSECAFSRNDPAMLSSLNSVANDAGNIDLVGGANVTVTADAVNKRITIDMASVPDDMVRVPGGTFAMGYAGLTIPVHQVTLSAFCLDKFEVTYGLWYAVRQWALSNGYSFQNAGREGSAGTEGAAPTWAQGEPVTTVSWRDAIVWCNARSQKEGLTPVYTCSGAVLRDSRHANSNACDGAVFSKAANGYRLPTEAEWEYAARYVRGSTELPGDWASGAWDNHGVAAACDAVAWYFANGGNHTHVVGTKKANQLGVFDLSGNAYEWCWDWYAAYVGSAVTDPSGPGTGTRRALRGGSWCFDALYLQGADRGCDTPTSLYTDYGFRCARRL